jgi:23S rRNA pseudouridine2605 synthase
MFKERRELEREAPMKFEVSKFAETERLSKRLSRLGICSRRQAERLIEQGMVRVDGKVIDHNVGVNDNNYIQIGAKTGMYTPTKQNTKVWLYHKPQKLMCTRFDPQERPTIFQQLAILGLNVPHVISVGRLDFLSEGLIILTNDGDLARAMELPTSKIERSYKVRVFGRMFNEDKLQRLRQGFTMNGRQYGPYIVDIINRQSTNTWLHMKLFEGKNNEIRKAMRKFSLRVNR